MEAIGKGPSRRMSVQKGLVYRFVTWLYVKVCIKADIKLYEQQCVEVEEQEMQLFLWSEPVVEFIPDSELLAEIVNERVH